jgi:ribosome-binding factor A
MQPIKKDTNRIAKVNSLIQHILAPVIHEFLDDPTMLVTISRVDTSKDMKWAKVWLSIFSGIKAGKETKTEAEKADAKTLADTKILEYLNKNIYFIQGEMNKGFATKIIPRISFYLDTSPRYVQHIDELIQEVHKEE